MKHRPLLPIICFLLFCFNSTFSATLYSRASTGFYTSGTWSTVACGGVSCACTPGAGDIIVICNGYNITLPAGAITVGPGGNCASITIQNGGVLDMLGAGVMTVKNGGFLTVNPTGSLQLNVFTNNNNSDGVTVDGMVTLGGASPVFTNGTGADIVGSGSISIGVGGTVTNNGTIFGSSGACSPMPCSLAPMPVELLSFNALYSDKKVDLTWETATETNNDYFTIERTKDGSVFETVSTVKGAGNSTSIIEYSDKDFSPYEGLSYYRLTQTDFNGEKHYSSLVAVNYTVADDGFTIYPNPSSDASSVVMNLSFSENQEVLVVVRDIQGKEFYSKVIITTQNNELVAVDPEHKIAAGTYVVVATSENKIYSKKLIIK